MLFLSIFSNLHHALKDYSSKYFAFLSFLFEAGNSLLRYENPDFMATGAELYRELHETEWGLLVWEFLGI